MISLYKIKVYLESSNKDCFNRSNSKSRSLSPTINSNKVSFAEVGKQFKPDLSATAGYNNKFKLSSSGK